MLDRRMKEDKWISWVENSRDEDLNEEIMGKCI
ncbi:hypothetical protein B0I49_005749 [Clostridium beijerinckii]|nr:hypothetical protein [Clostridium beijerinckii]